MQKRAQGVPLQRPQGQVLLHQRQQALALARVQGGALAGRVHAGRAGDLRHPGVPPHAQVLPDLPPGARQRARHARGVGPEQAAHVPVAAAAVPAAAQARHGRAVGGEAGDPHGAVPVAAHVRGRGVVVVAPARRGRHAGNVGEKVGEGAVLGGRGPGRSGAGGCDAVGNERRAKQEEE